MRIPLIAYHNAVTPGAFIGRSARLLPVSETLAGAIAGRYPVMDFTRRLSALAAKTNLQPVAAAIVSMTLARLKTAPYTPSNG